MSTHLAAAIIAKIGSFDLGDCAPDEDPEEARLQHIEREVLRTAGPCTDSESSCLLSE
jgi:hypothetical protein